MKILCNFFSRSDQFIKNFSYKIEGDFNFFVNFLRAPKARSRAAGANKRRKRHCFPLSCMFPSFNFAVSYFFFERTGPHEEPLNSLRGPAIALHQLARDIAEDYVYEQIIHINQTPRYYHGFGSTVNSFGFKM